MAGEATGVLLAAQQLEPGCLDGAGGRVGGFPLVELVASWMGMASLAAQQLEPGCWTARAARCYLMLALFTCAHCSRDVCF